MPAKALNTLNQELPWSSSMLNFLMSGRLQCAGSMPSSSFPAVRSSPLSGPGATLLSHRVALLSHRVVMRLPPRHAVPPPTPGAVPPGNQIRASLPLHYSARPGLSAQQRPRLPEVPLLQISRLLCPRLAAGPSGIRIQTASKIRRWFRKE